MNTQYLTVNDGSQGEEVEYLTARLPDSGIAVLLLTFLVKPIDLSDLARLVVASN